MYHRCFNFGGWYVSEEFHDNKRQIDYEDILILYFSSCFSYCVYFYSYVRKISKYFSK